MTSTRRRSSPKARRSSTSSPPRDAPARRGLLIGNTPAMASAAPAELAKFNDLAHRWWDPHGEFRRLHELNPLRLEWIERPAGLDPFQGQRIDFMQRPELA